MGPKVVFCIYKGTFLFKTVKLSKAGGFLIVRGWCIIGLNQLSGLNCRWFWSRCFQVKMRLSASALCLRIPSMAGSLFELMPSLRLEKGENHLARK